MKEIKFRVWDKKQNKFLKYGEYSFHFNDYGDLLVYIEFGNYYLQLGEYIILEYTGLKDKNGKEIYEGDIVRILYTDWVSQPSDDNRTLEEYMRDIAEVKVVQWNYNGFYVSNSIGGYNETMNYGKHGYIEIIGNIYENKYLLTNK